MIVMYVITGEVGQVGMIILMRYTKELENVLLCGGMLGSQGRDLCDMMKLSRARFKYSLRFIKQHESQLRKDALANKLAQGKPDEFWKDVRLMNNFRTPLPYNYVALHNLL